LETFETLREHLLADLETEQPDPVSDEDGGEWRAESGPGGSGHPLTRLFRLPIAAFDALASGAYGTVVALAGAAGYRSVNDLTNIIFYFRHPEAVGRRIQPHELDLQRAWLEIRDTIVRPALQRTSPPGPTSPAGRTSVPGRTSLSAENLSWYGVGPATPELMAFMRAVYQRHLARSKGAFVDTLPASSLSVIEGNHRAQSRAAQEAVRLLAAARADLRTAGRDAREQIGITSAYRSAQRQFEIWQGKGAGGKRGFPYYYNATAQARRRFSDPHGPEAVAYLASVMAKWIAAPGYSNHQDGLAIDFGTGRAGARGLRKISANDWFHRWLVDNAARFGYRPYQQEPWHWVYRPDPAAAQEADDWEKEPGVLAPAAVVGEKFDQESTEEATGFEATGFDEAAGLDEAAGFDEAEGRLEMTDARPGGPQAWYEAPDAGEVEDPLAPL
jgi:LAS superfamily LD-carboxypeptidase LdcB